MKLVVVVAHPDDEVLGAGGTMMRSLGWGWDVEVVVVGDGRIGPRDNRGSLKEACGQLGVNDFEFLGFPMQKFDQMSAQLIADRVREATTGVDVVLTHPGDELGRDHQIVHEAVCVAVRRRPVSVLGIEVPGYAAWGGRAFPAQVYVELSEEQVAGKVAAFRRYVNEIREAPDPWSAEMLESLARVRGSHASVEYAEAFTVIRATMPLQ
jgi:LmbE family N-acetylglucosaminyl deacetylase